MEKEFQKILKLSVYLIPLVLIILTITSSYILMNSFKNISRERFDIASENLIASAESQIDNYEIVLKDASSTFNLLEEFNRKSWIEYFSHILSLHSLRGIASVYYVPIIPKDAVDEFETSIRNDRSVVYDGLDEFEIESTSETGPYFPATYIYPLEGLEDTLGWDIGQESVRREALNRAWTSGLASASDVFNFLINNEPGFHYLIPFPADIHTTNEPVDQLEVEGFISMAFSVNDFFDTIFDNSPKQSADVYIEVWEDNNIIYSRGQVIDIVSDETLKNEKTISFGGKRIKFLIYSEPDFSNEEVLSIFPLLVLFVGGALSLTSGIIIYLVSFSTSKIHNQAEKLNEDLQITKSRFSDILNNTSALIYVKDLNGKYVFANKAFIEILDIRFHRIENRLDLDLFPVKIANKIEENDKKALTIGDEITVEEILPTKDHGDLIYSSRKFPLFNNKGEIYAVASISTNINESKMIEDELRKRNEELENLNRLMVDRELKMIELKEKIDKYENG